MSKTIERRLFDATLEIRQSADGKTVGLRGYAARFDEPAHGEVVRRSAFNRTLAQNDNVRLLVNHEGVPIASTRAGTMTLTTDERGLLVDAPALDISNPTVQELVSAMSRGDIDQMSFAFTASDDPTIGGVRELRECRLYDVSVVTYPWYDTTSVGLIGDRDMDRALIALRSLTPEQREQTIVALGDLYITAPVTDSSTDASTETEIPAPVADPIAPADGMTACPACGEPTPTGSAFCCNCGIPILDPTLADPTAAPMLLASHTVAEARALLGLPPAA